MKRIISVIVLLLSLACGCAKLQRNETPKLAQGQQDAGGAEKEYSYVSKSFDYYHNNGSVFNTFEFLQNPTETKDKCLFAGEKLEFRFRDEDGKLILKTMGNSGKNQYYDMYGFFAYRRGFYPNEQCSDAIAFLCDEEAIKEEL